MRAFNSSSLYKAAAALCAVAAAGLAAADAPQPASIAFEPAKVINARQTMLDLSGGTMAGMKAAIDAGQDVKNQAFAAQSLARWAAAMPDMFPAGTGPEAGPSHAKPEVWSDRAGFLAAADRYRVEAKKLTEIAKTGDKAFAAQWSSVRQTCSACHAVYRSGLQ